MKPTGLEHLIFPELPLCGVESLRLRLENVRTFMPCATHLFRSIIPCNCHSWLALLGTTIDGVRYLIMKSTKTTYGSSETQHLNTWATIGLDGSSQFARCNQSAILIVQPLYSTWSTNFRSFVGILNVVILGIPSVSWLLCSGLAVPGPAGREAKLVEDAYGGPEGGSEDTRAWYSRWLIHCG